MLKNESTFCMINDIRIRMFRVNDLPDSYINFPTIIMYLMTIM